ncbi:MAG: hypothetical protein MPJ50_15395 [Pirellulales bacterium]|nr:hypothetical protein [Pirellulales bacterium]
MGKRKAAEWLEQILAAKDEVTGPAEEILSKLYEALLQLPEFELADGTKAQVEAYYPPGVDEEGEVHCGIDVRLSNGSLLEFTLKNSGWEKLYIQDHAPERKSQNR